MKRKQQSAVLLLCLCVLPVTAAANCEYSINNEWSNGFTANIQIANDSDSTISGWEVSWAYSDGSTITSSWSAELAGSNPYSASPLTWNGTIQPGQSVEFGVQGSKGAPGSAAEKPLVTGDICSNGVSSTSSTITRSSSALVSSSSTDAISSSTSSSSPPSSSSTSSASSDSVLSSSSGENCERICQWYEDGQYPLCVNLSSGWSWERNQSCIGIDTCNDQFSTGGVVEICTSRSSSSSSSSTNSSSSISKSSTASFSSTSSVSEVYEAVSTHFYGLGSPYGGCGVPQDTLETEHFVALNVFNSPNIYDQWPRPITGDDLQYMGEFQNGMNCGRWVRVTMGENCSGINDGARDEPFCRNGSGWFDDQYSGATLDFIVADSCGDDNAWCRDSQYHLDFSMHSLSQFTLDGAPVGEMLPDNFNNRKIRWQYIEAPDYSDDISIFFMKGAQEYWPTILITNLRNGIHSVEQLVDNEWITVERNHDMGQSFILEMIFEGSYIIRVRDVNDELINDGRQYVFDLPESCGEICSDPVVETTYSTM